MFLNRFGRGRGKASVVWKISKPMGTGSLSSNSKLGELETVNRGTGTVRAQRCAKWNYICANSSMPFAWPQEWYEAHGLVMLGSDIGWAQLHEARD